MRVEGGTRCDSPKVCTAHWPHTFAHQEYFCILLYIMNTFAHYEYFCIHYEYFCTLGILLLIKNTFAPLPLGIQNMFCNFSNLCSLKVCKNDLYCPFWHLWTFILKHCLLCQMKFPMLNVDCF